MAATVKAKGKRAPRQVWKKEEDAFLLESVQCEGTKKWSLIADKLQELFQNKTKRTGKQCRTRWLNHLDPSINKGP